MSSVVRNRASRLCMAHSCMLSSQFCLLSAPPSFVLSVPFLYAYPLVFQQSPTFAALWHACESGREQVLPCFNIDALELGR